MTNDRTASMEITVNVHESVLSRILVEEFNISTPSLVFLPVFIQARICIVDRAFF